MPPAVPRTLTALHFALLGLLGLLGLPACGGPAGPIYRPEAVLACALEPSAHATEPGWDGAGDVTVDTNALGLRGPDVVVPRPEDVFRILVIGDEFSFGSGVERDERWTDRMQQDLAAADGRRIELVTAAAPGWCPAQQFLFLRKQGLELRPDLVLWQLATDDLRELALMELTFDTRGLPIGRLPRPVQDDRLRAALIDALHIQDRDDFEEQLALFHLGRSTPALESALEDILMERRASLAALDAEPVSPPTLAAPGSPIGFEALPSADIGRRLRAETSFAVLYFKHLVEVAGNLCRAADIPLRLMLVDDEANLTARRPGREARALRAWADRQDPSTFDTRQALAGGMASRNPQPLDALLWSVAQHRTVGSSAALWLASDRSTGLTPASVDG